MKPDVYDDYYMNYKEHIENPAGINDYKNTNSNILA